MTHEFAIFGLAGLWGTVRLLSVLRVIARGGSTKPATPP